ncbi:MAG: ATP synthase F1 subunit gamma [Planctomycetota bacterium]|nr:ATP synthase F1 subunit gamma [Planctomycetota bacterium]MDA1140977.1 ATP synthase F1 subunit gamma [Planctomycetota bacterium]
MANLKQIRNRIRSVKSTQQITRVMEMVSASKLAKTLGLLNRAQPYAEGLEGLMKRVVGAMQDEEGGVTIDNPFMQARQEVKKRCMVVFVSDRGLCGAYNNNLISTAEKVMQGGQEGWVLACVGKKALVYFKKRGWNIGYSLVDTQGRVSGEQLHKLSGYITGGFLAGDFDEVHLSFTAFRSAARYTPTTNLFIPLKPEAVEQDNADYIFEPDAPQLLSRLVPDHLAAKINTSILQAFASEHAARMTAMRNATDNAKEMIESLTLQMNKARQSAITTEISEIVGGAEAIKS